MFLSKLALNMRDTLNAYNIHHLIWQLFPAMPNAERSFLFRLERIRRGPLVSILMQSDIAPQQGITKVQVLVTKPIELKFQPGQQLRFLLCANPTKRLSKERCRVPFIREDEQRAWLERKLQGASRLDAVQITGQNILYFNKHASAGKIYTVNFSGLMTIISPKHFLELVRSGIGSGKSFGCGLISVARV